VAAIFAASFWHYIPSLPGPISLSPPYDYSQMHMLILFFLALWDEEIK